METETTSKNCAVALLDILGSRTHDTEVTPRVKKRMDILRQSIERVIEETKKLIKQSGSELPDPQYMAFGDSVLFLWALDDEHRFLPFIAYALGDVFVDALENGIPLRGALSFGHVRYDNQVALGPAVSDAGAWYEKANALAIIVTPRTGLLVDMYRPQDPDLIDRAFTKFGFQLKGINGKRDMWAVSWPSVLRERAQQKGIAETEIRPRLLATLYERFVIPIEAESKYAEILPFFDECASRWANQADAEQQDGRS